MAGADTRYKRQPRRTTRPSLHRVASKVPALSDRLMPAPAPVPSTLNGHKRRRSEAAQRNDTSQPAAKRQRVDHQSQLHPPHPPRTPQTPHTSQTTHTPQTSHTLHRPLTVWDNVSKVWLTRRALKELDRRTGPARPTPRPAHQQAHRPVTRSCTAKLKQSDCSSQRTIDHLGGCEPKTARKITLFARHGGPDLSDVRNYPERSCPSVRAMSSRRSSYRSRGLASAATQSTRPTTDTQRTKSTGPYDRQFQQILVDNGIYPHGYRYSDGRAPPKPDNWDVFGQMLARPRPSLSPSKFGDADFDDFVQADADAGKEQQVCELVLPYIEGRVADGKCRSGAVPFGNLEDLTDRPLTQGKPDVYYGARPEQLERGVRDALGHHIIPSTQEDLPLAPNFFLEAKGPDGSAAVAKRQVCYVGALGARGMHSLQAYSQSAPAHDNNAYVMSSVYHNGQLQMYTNHVGPTRAVGGRSETFMNQLNTYGMTGSRDAFRTGATAYRNARDWAKEQRDTAIAQANEHLRAQAEASTDDASASPALSFVTAEETEASYTLTQESGTSVSEQVHGSREPYESEESDTSFEELAVYTLPAKRSTRHSARQRAQRKRHNG